MRNQWKKSLFLAGITAAAAAVLTGCYSYATGFGSYNQVPKTTAARDTLEEFNIADLQTDEGVFQFGDVEWGSNKDRLGEALGQEISSTQSFSDGGSYSEISYSILLQDKISVSVMPVFDADGGLTMLAFYFENTYTAEELDTLYDDVVKLCTSEFGASDEVRDDEQTSGRTTYTSQTTFWYHEISETEMTSLQIGKIDSGKGTDAVVVGINIFDPAELEEETETNSVEETETNSKES